MRAVVSGVDTYRWVADGEIRSADRGDEIDVSADEFDRVEGALSKPGSRDAQEPDGAKQPPGWPSTHNDLQALADSLSFEWPETKMTVAAKIAALEAAGHTPPAAE
ncbi:hypothetical protein Gocc_2908 [Gaiella occulta]|uniref:Uncharacterized protein n=1 Tax=Gaiella occulta TaxID=1002870 RepID=A0A7M2YV59_9ACTN|nr:hypothetical protein [Gaiella occulta]RDI73308.1 hypothetical protein Gocc_2908 [Gaiella occulta]